MVVFAALAAEWEVGAGCWKAVGRAGAAILRCGALSSCDRWVARAGASELGRSANIQRKGRSSQDFELR